VADYLKKVNRFPYSGHPINIEIDFKQRWKEYEK
jgi:hypothetical protein